MRIHIQNGRLLDPSSQLDGQHDLFIADGKIVGIKNKPDGFVYDLQIDAQDQLVIPGIVDLCARLREPDTGYLATFATELLAANKSGITSICCPPDTDPIIDTPAVVELIQQRTRHIQRSNIYPLAALSKGLKGEQLAEIHRLNQAGCLAVSNALLPIANTEILRRAFEYAYSCGLTVFYFAEDHTLKNDGVAHEGFVSTRLGLPPIPETAETVALSRALLLAEQVPVKIHFCRIATARGVQLIKQAQAQGLPVTADVGICHLHLTQMDIADYNSHCHLQPPLRSERDRQGLLNGICEGVITAVCSDHQPHNADAKSAPFSLTKPGASTIEHLLPLMLHLVQRKALKLEQAINAICTQPAAILGIDKGTIKIGGAADLCIVDLNACTEVDHDNMLSAGKNTPFNGWVLPGNVCHTIYHGRVVFKQE